MTNRQAALLAAATLGAAPGPRPATSMVIQEAEAFLLWLGQDEPTPASPAPPSAPKQAVSNRPRTR